MRLLQEAARQRHPRRPRHNLWRNYKHLLPERLKPTRWRATCACRPKARLVIDLIRGPEGSGRAAVAAVYPKRAAKHIEKVLRSAIANAERKADDSGSPLDVDQLYVHKAFVTKAPRWKRLRPAPMGRAFRYQKRTAHIFVGVAEHHVAAAERVAADVAEAEAQKGVRGTARRVRKALTGKQAPGKKGKK